MDDSTTAVLVDLVGCDSSSSCEAAVTALVLRHKAATAAAIVLGTFVATLALFVCCLRPWTRAVVRWRRKRADRGGGDAREGDVVELNEVVVVVVDDADADDGFEAVVVHGAPRWPFLSQNNNNNNNRDSVVMTAASGSTHDGPAPAPAQQRVIGGGRDRRASSVRGEMVSTTTTTMATEDPDFQLRRKLRRPDSPRPELTTVPGLPDHGPFSGFGRLKGPVSRAVPVPVPVSAGGGEEEEEEEESSCPTLRPRTLEEDLEAVRLDVMQPERRRV